MTRNRVLAVLVAVATFACTTKDNTTTNNVTPTTPPPTFTSTYTLQGFVADAVTGQRIGDAQLFLIQGATVRTPTRYNAADALRGEYAFADVPLDYYDTNKTYKIVAVRNGYQRFESEISYQAIVGAITAPLDTVYNYIGNIYMFPVGASAPSMRFTVSYNGKPVPGATVLFDPVQSGAAGSGPLFNAAHALTSVPSGYEASLSATTDPNGIVTFAGSLLALGAAYSVEVLPLTFTDSAGTAVPLQRYNGATSYVVGVNNTDNLITLTDLVVDNLYITKITTLPVGSGQVTADGSLEITFSAPVTLQLGATGFGATITTATGAAYGGTATLNTPGAQGVLLNDRTLRLTPNFNVQLAAGEANVGISYNDGTAFVEAKDYPAIRRNVFDLLMLNGATAANASRVVMRAP